MEWNPPYLRGEHKNLAMLAKDSREREADIKPQMSSCFAGLSVTDFAIAGGQREPSMRLQTA